MTTISRNRAVLLLSLLVVIFSSCNRDCRKQIKAKIKYPEYSWRIFYHPMNPDDIKKVFPDKDSEKSDRCANGFFACE